jgi:hypothetical protein
MRRAGEILTGRADSGPLYDEGRDYLERADAAEGDEPPTSRAQ